MDRHAFEQHILELVHHYGVRHLTTRRVAAEFDISEEDAERHLDELVTTGTLELDTDDEGNLFYYVPGSVEGGVFAGNRDMQLHDDGPQAAARGPYGAPFNDASRPGMGPNPYGSHGQTPRGYESAETQSPYGGPQASQGPFGPAPPWGASRGPGHPHPPHRMPGPYGSGNHPGGSFPYDPRHAEPHGYGPTSSYPGPRDQYPAPYGGGHYPTNMHQRSEKSPTTAALLSFFPGAGQLYNGEFGKAFFFFFLTTFFYMMPPFGFLMGMLPHAWSVLDAAASARRQNYGMLPP